MDRLDTGILREIGRNQSGGPFPSTVVSLRRIAQVAGVDKETVRARLAGLGKQGVLSGWHAMVNPRVLSLKVTRVWIEFASEASKEEGVNRLTTKEELRVVYDYAGSSVSFVMVTDAEKLPQIQGSIIESLPPPRHVFAASMKFPSTNAALSETDWKIYNSIRSDPQKTHRMISKETGFGIRTIKRRLNRMSEENAVLVAPNLDPSKVGGISADLLVGYKTDDISKSLGDKVMAKIGEYLIHVTQFEEPFILYTIVADSISEARGIYRMVRTFAGVESYRLYFLQGLVQIRKPLSVLRQVTSQAETRGIGVRVPTALSTERSS